MERQGRKTGRWRQGALAWVAVMACGVAGARAATPTPEQVHAYVQMGRVHLGNQATTRLENQLQAKDGFAAFVTADSLYVQELVQECLLGICGGVCMARPGTTLALPLPSGGGGRIPAMGLLRVVREGAGEFPANVQIALVMPGGKLHRENIHRDAAGRLIRTAGLPVLTLKSPDAWVRAFADLREAYPGALRQGFLIMGLGGRMSLVDENEGSLGGMTETVLEPANPADITCHGGGWVGTSSGDIFRLTGTGGLPRLSDPEPPSEGRPVLSIGPRMALVQGGFRLNQEGRWSGVRQGPENLRGVLTSLSAEGTRIEMYRDTGAAVVETWDSPTHLEFRRGEQPWQGPGGGSLRVERDLPVAYQVAFRDVDHNATPPSLVLFHGDAGTVLFPRATQAVPGLGCRETGRCLPGAETLLGVEMRSDSVKLTMQVLDGVLEVGNAPCLRATFKGDTVRFAAGEPWGNGSWLEVRVGGQRLVFQYGEPVGIAHPRTPRRVGVGPTGLSGVFRILARGPDGSCFGVDGRLSDPPVLRAPAGD